MRQNSIALDIAFDRKRFTEEVTRWRLCKFNMFFKFVQNYNLATKKQLYQTYRTKHKVGSMLV